MEKNILITPLVSLLFVLTYNISAQEISDVGGTITGIQLSKNANIDEHAATEEVKMRLYSKNNKADAVGNSPTVQTTNSDLSSLDDFIEMVKVEGGSFQMGSNFGRRDEKPVHKVTLSTFYIGKYEINQKQWKAIMGSNPSGFKDCDNCPVESVSWNDVQEFLQKLCDKTGISYRLPTEAEWEYAARGGVNSKGYTYSGSNSLDDVGWYSVNSGFKIHANNLKSNELGIFDMSGNVWEWCSDWYSGSYYDHSPEYNPEGPDSGTYRVYRGGSLSLNATQCLVGYRGSNSPDHRYTDLGFRVALSQ
ncbi:MAG: formylglycine-generating enzyme family protein [Saprospiraceae bacterium]